MLEKLNFWPSNQNSVLDDNEREELEEKKIKKDMLDVVIVTFLYFVLILVVSTHTLQIYEVDDFASLGDSFGVITSIFTGLAFFGLAVTIRLQRRAIRIQEIEMKHNRRVLEEQSDTLKIQQAENTFLRLLDHTERRIKNIDHEKISKDIETLSKSLEYCFTALYIQNILNESTNEDSGAISDSIDKDAINEKFKIAYEQYIRPSTEGSIGDLLRILEIPLTFIDSNEVLQNQSIYVDCIRSLLTPDAQALIAYFLFANQRDRHKCCALILKHKLLDEMDQTSLAPSLRLPMHAFLAFNQESFKQ